jgi:hypothetical protein
VSPEVRSDFHRIVTDLEALQQEREPPEIAPLPKVRMTSVSDHLFSQVFYRF